MTSKNLDKYPFFSKIDTIVFDFGGVIVNLDIEQCIRKINALGVVNVEQFLSNYGQKDFFLKFEKGEISTSEFRDSIRKMASAPLTDEQIDDAWCAFLVDIPKEKIEIIRELKKNFKLLLLSNTNPLHIEKSAVKALAPYNCSLNDLFDKCYLSYEMKMTKPNEDIFIRLLNDAGVNAENCLFLDDGPKNIETANKLGFQTYLVDPKESLDFLLCNINV